MKILISMLCAVFASASFGATTPVWQPSPGHTQIPIWPDSPPDTKPMPGPEYAKSDPTLLIGGKPGVAVGNVSQPTMTVYNPIGKNTGAAVVVFPGGGFQILAMDLEGTEVCDWLAAKGITCVLLKYRVPGQPYVWQCDCRPHNLSLSMPSLQDAQRTLRLVRAHASAWHIDPHKIGVLGFSAGGYLVAETSTNFKRRVYAPVDAADNESARPDFAVAVYPGHIATDKNTLNPNVPVSRDTPPTFLVQAEDDHVDGIHQALVYYTALKDAGVPVEMHLYAEGGHAFGLRRTDKPITHWPDLVDTWLITTGVVSH